MYSFVRNKKPLDAATCHFFHTVIFFLETIPSLQVLLQVISLSHP